MSKRKQTKIWTTRDGRKIRICDMDDSHLVNTIKYCRRIAKIQLDKIQINPPSFQGEMAQWTAENEWLTYCDMCEDEFIERTAWADLFNAMLKDAVRRGLEV